MTRARFIGTLVLALALLASLAILGSQFLLPRYVADAGKSPEDWEREFRRAAQLNMASVALSVRRFTRTKGQLPLHLEEVPDLREPDGRAPKDPWGSEYRYDRESNESFVLQSAGPDRVFGTGDDLVHGDAPKDLALEAAVQNLDSRALGSRDR
jgi:hypothetical protein